MRTRRALLALFGTASLVLLLIVLTLIVTALDQPIGAIAVLGLALLALLAARVVTRRVRRGTVLEIDLENGVVEQPPSHPVSRLLNREAVVLRDVTNALARARDDDRIVGLVARLGNGGIALAQAQEIRDAVYRFRESGKRTVAFAETFGETRLAINDYYLATAFEEVHLQPMGNLSIEGVVSRVPFLRDLLDRIGVTPDLDHREEHKSAKYLLTERDFTDPHRESVTGILADQFDQIVSGIAGDRDLGPERVRELIDSAPLIPSEALREGLVDSISHRDDAYEAARGDGKGFLFLDRYLRKAGRPNRRGHRIALVYGTGTINRGRSGFDPLERASSMGADDVSATLREAVDDKKVRAIVFRVDSRGGSATASEVIGREVARAREAGKPIVVSMGSVAGSGGYWISAPADRIVAQPGTVTGSIGVVAGKLARGEAWRRLGVNWGELHLGQNATFSVPLSTYTESERERANVMIDAIYRGFLDHVAGGRDMDVAAVTEIAGGRVWTGAQALERGLVDHLGGLERAIEVAREVADIGSDEPVQLRLFPRQRTLPWPQRKESSEPVGAIVRAISDLLNLRVGGLGQGAQLLMPGDWRL